MILALFNILLAFLVIMFEIKMIRRDSYKPSDDRNQIISEAYKIYEQYSMRTDEKIKELQNLTIQFTKVTSDRLDNLHTILNTNNDDKKQKMYKVQKNKKS